MGKISRLFPGCFFDLNCSHSFYGFCHSIYSTALTPKTPINHNQVTLLCRKQGDTEVRRPGWVTFGHKLFKPQLSCLENEFKKSLSLIELLYLHDAYKWPHRKHPMNVSCYCHIPLSHTGVCTP